MNAVVVYGTPLIDDPNRVEAVTAIGLDETLFARSGVFRFTFVELQEAIECLTARP